ncbi:hypothetical protein BT96DRAFT_939271 [Gymnopus androsaceus JB14]|uniref:Uncharacterized protein n=1 Tax=Gymnopus androsaceus JB14 TaxID=1447944 RepID=A0A6A4HQG2_9AGAR|nr:hypothetical protein BT96DRAFT_939271 [Gymnopus androsaceus JB14]
MDITPDNMQNLLEKIALLEARNKELEAEMSNAWKKPGSEADLEIKIADRNMPKVKPIIKWFSNSIQKESKRDNIDSLNAKPDPVATPPNSSRKRSKPELMENEEPRKNSENLLPSNQYVTRNPTNAMSPTTTQTRHTTSGATQRTIAERHAKMAEIQREINQIQREMEEEESEEQVRREKEAQEKAKAEAEAKRKTEEAEAKAKKRRAEKRKLTEARLVKEIAARQAAKKKKRERKEMAERVLSGMNHAPSAAFGSNTKKVTHATVQNSSDWESEDTELAKATKGEKRKRSATNSDPTDNLSGGDDNDHNDDTFAGPCDSCIKRGCEQKCVPIACKNSKVSCSWVGKKESGGQRPRTKKQKSESREQAEQAERIAVAEGQNAEILRLLRRVVSGIPPEIPRREHRQVFESLEQSESEESSEGEETEVEMGKKSAKAKGKMRHGTAYIKKVFDTLYIKNGLALNFKLSEISGMPVIPDYPESRDSIMSESKFEF